ncbi:MAG: hypothetical protein WC551_04040 [Patescibacteria group bacterium]
MPKKLPTDYLWAGDKIKRDVDFRSIEAKKIDFDKLKKLTVKTQHIFQRDEQAGRSITQQASVA